MTEPLQGLFLVVDDIEAARDDLISRGVDVGEIWHLDLAKGPQSGLDPEGRSYSNRASFADPDGNQWVLQQITERLPGRVERDGHRRRSRSCCSTTALHHGAFEAHRAAARLVELVRAVLRRAPARRDARARPTRSPTATWRRHTVSWFPDEVASLEALEERVSRHLRRR